MKKVLAMLLVALIAMGSVMAGGSSEASGEAKIDENISMYVTVKAGGALDVRARDISEGMKVAAAKALAALVGDELSRDYIIPSPFDRRVAPAVAKAVADAAVKEGLARI